MLKKKLFFFFIFPLFILVFSSIQSHSQSDVGIDRYLPVVTLLQNESNEVKITGLKVLSKINDFWPEFVWSELLILVENNDPLIQAQLKLTIQTQKIIPKLFSDGVALIIVNAMKANENATLFSFSRILNLLATKDSKQECLSIVLSTSIHK